MKPALWPVNNITSNIEKYAEIYPSLTPLEGIDINTLKYSAKWGTQFITLFDRAWTSNVRSSKTGFAKYLVNAVFGLIGIALYYNVLFVLYFSSLDPAR